VKQTALAVLENGVLRPTTLLLHLREGQRVFVTVEPIEELDPEEYARRRAEMLQRMEAEGMFEHVPPPAEPPPKDWQPLILKGEPLSETVIKMRRGE
jgi:predicted DNA-binding antitoxin AbrB/MazE fold protein